VIIIYNIDSYKDLCSEIEISKIRIEGLEGQKKELKKLLDGPQEISCQQYSDLPKGSHNYLSIDRVVDSLSRIDSMLEIENSLLKAMIITQTKLNEKLKGLQGIEYKIMYKREIEGKSFARIGQELNYSEMQVGRIFKKLECETC
jgi:DNA-directed RNA polymerase specialized sigma subunit